MKIFVEGKYRTLSKKNGSLSLIKKDDANMAHAIVIDGKIIDGNLTAHGYDKNWLKKRLDEHGARLYDVFLMTINDEGKINIILREEEA